MDSPKGTHPNLRRARLGKGGRWPPRVFLFLNDFSFSPLLSVGLTTQAVLKESRSYSTLPLFRSAPSPHAIAGQMPKFYHSKKSYMECFRIKLLHKNEFKNSLILYKVKKCIYIQNKSFVKKTKNKKQTRQWNYCKRKKPLLELR